MSKERVMPSSAYVLGLRAKIGHDLLWMPGVTAVVLNAKDELLLVKRSDNGMWSLPAGWLEPGEEPADGLAREISEETGVQVRVERLLSVLVLRAHTYPNGDNVQALDLAFRCVAVSGVARVNDDECTDVRWFSLNALPSLPQRQANAVERAMANSEGTWFVPVNRDAEDAG
jgi:ADP-ribose pyrophosphatase YjhB (NUDIX family)